MDITGVDRFSAGDKHLLDVADAIKGFIADGNDEYDFVLCEVGPEVTQIHGSLLGEGLIVRAYPASSQLANSLRFTVRTPEAHERLLDAIRRTRD